MSSPTIPPPPNIGGAGSPVVVALTQLIIQQVPGFTIGMQIVSNQMMNHIVRVIKENVVGLIGSLLSTVGIAALVPSLIIATVNAIGFTSGGVLAGSIAAAIQSSVYGGYTAGLFSAFQSFGATAVIAPPVALALGGVSLAVGAGFIGYWWWKRRRQGGSGSGGPDNDNDKKDKKSKKSACSTNPETAVVKRTSSFSIFQGIFTRRG